jgi:hypothetical protein
MVRIALLLLSSRSLPGRLPSSQVRPTHLRHFLGTYIDQHGFATMPPKRRATSPIRPPSASKKRETAQPKDEPVFDHSRPEERAGIVQREFYPPEMSNERCQRYLDSDLPRPLQVLNHTLSETQATRDNIPLGSSVVHWFKRDLRLQDNRSLSLASQKAKEKGIVCTSSVRKTTKPMRQALFALTLS